MVSRGFSRVFLGFPMVSLGFSRVSYGFWMGYSYFVFLCSGGDSEGCSWVFVRVF